MKTVMYVITSLSHKRVFESFEERADLTQIIVGPKPNISSKINIVPEDYSDFKIKDIRFFNNNGELQRLIDSINPDVYVQASLPIAQGVKLPKRCKKVYVSHGMVGNHVKGIIKQAGFDTSVWKGCDLYCGATEVFADWIKHVVKVGDDQILLNALPQLDILHNSQYYQAYKNKILQKTQNPHAKKIVLFVGFEGKHRVDFIDHNEDYFATVIELEKIAKKNNWVVLVKPRHSFQYMKKFLNQCSWGVKYIDAYSDVQKSKYLHFITTTGHIYRYMSADAIVINGCSTVEVEACVIKKPLFVIRTKVGPKTYDPFGTILHGAAHHISNIKELGRELEEYFKGISNYSTCAQEYFISDILKININGMMHKTIQDKIKTI